MLPISDYRLVLAAQRAADSIQWDSLRGRNCVWEKKKTIGDFGIYTRHNGDVHHIMASGSVSCSLREMEHMLRTTSDERYVTAMTELHGTQFLSGAVLHRINTHDVMANFQQQEEPQASLQPTPQEGVDLSIKAATFAKAHMFARNEQWYYLDYFQAQPERERFVLTMHSLNPCDFTLPTAASATSKDGSNNANDALDMQSKNQLQNMCAGYSVVFDKRRSVVWVVFYAQFDNASASSASAYHNRDCASTSTTRARLMKLATATCCLPMLVRRRRLGVQVFADLSAFTPPNTHCIGCTVALLPLLSQRKRCHLCGYYVCLKCSTKQPRERAFGSPRDRLARVCFTCTRRVNTANYDRVQVPIASCAAIKPNPKNEQGGSECASHKLAELLHASMKKNAQEPLRQRAIVQVIQHILEQDNIKRESKNSESKDDDRVSMPPLSLLSASPSLSQRDTSSTSTSTRPSSNANAKSSPVIDLDAERYSLNALETQLHVPELALEDCVVANADSRAYPISYKDESAEGVPDFPVPEHEARRMNVVRQIRFCEMLNLPELEIICAIASKELKCSAGLVTIVDKDMTHVVASSAEGFQNVVVPREESICAHTVMSDKPLLLPHCDADIRFSKLAAVQGGAVNFYCGFPIITSDNTVVGSMCCVGSESHDVTQAQYAMLLKLASTASRVLECHAQAHAA
uniref:FYVE-type domain-containing protein n=1 Tax=Globisporangium ultimum (strain ATCC 200006 / CBS 805.95 / DAOM BR144) TaxID=431595 RepID=K3X781_GLOUD